MMTVFFEIHCSPLPICQRLHPKPAAKYGTRLGMAFLEFIKEHYTVGATTTCSVNAHPVVSNNIPGGAPIKRAPNVFLHVFTHIDPHNRLFRYRINSAKAFTVSVLPTPAA